MTRAEKQKLFELAQQVLTELGGRGTVQEVAAHLRTSHPDVFMAEAERGWIVQVRNAMRRKDGETGLPAAVSVGNQEYVQLKILLPEEYEYAISSYLRRARSNESVARRMADECLMHHGVSIDVDELKAGIAS